MNTQETKTCLTIWKFALNEETILMPQGARLLAVQMQDEVPHVWAEVDPSVPHVRRRLVHVGTGWEGGVEAGYHYVGTFQQGWMVFHLYDAGEVA